MLRPDPVLPRILFVSYGGGHISMVIPVVKHLASHRLAEPVVLALTIAGSACERAGVPYVAFRDFLRPEDDHALRIGEELLSGEPLHPDVDLAESIAYHGISYVDLVQRYGADEAREMYEVAGRRCFRPERFLTRVIDEVAPDLVVATNSPRAERAAIDAASSAGVPACCLLDAFGIQEEWVAEPGYGDRVCVLGESVKRMLVSRGRAPTDIVVTGNPAFDALQSVVEARVGAPHHNFRVLWAAHAEPPFHPITGVPSPHPDLPAHITAELTRAATEHPDWEIVIRPHPTMTDFEVPGAPDNLSVVAHDLLEDRLVWASVVVTVASTVAVQAAVAGVPVVAVGGSVISPDVSFVEDGLAHAADVRTLRSVLARLCVDPTTVDPGLPPPGGATERVAQVLLSLCPGSGYQHESPPSTQMF